MNARTVLKVDFQTVGPSLEWLPSRRYELHAYHPDGPQISIYDRPYLAIAFVFAQAARR